MTSTFSINKLSYEEELALGDRCVAKRKVTDLLELEDRQPTNEEKRIIRDGDAAARELVESYLPFIRSCANKIIKSHGGSGSILEEGDLVAIGTTNALLRTRSFNPRGKPDENGEQPKRAGKRFANYIRKDVTKAMSREATAMNSVMTGDPTKIINTNRWHAAKMGFREDHGRLPTEHELEELTGLDSTMILNSNYQFSSAGQIEEWTTEADNADVRMIEPSERVELGDDGVLAALTLIRAISHVFKPSEVHYIVQAYGLIDSEPKDPDQLFESYPEKFTSTMASRRWMKGISARITHPQYLRRIRLALRNQGELVSPTELSERW